MVKLDHVPTGLIEILNHYGNPDSDGDFVPDKAWVEKNLRRFRLPYPLRLSWNPDQLIRYVLAHRLVGDAMMDALDEIGQVHGGRYLEQNQLNRFGGVYNPRLKRGLGQLSTHTWAIAIDLNPEKAPLGADPSGQPGFVVEAFTKRGFMWGGEFKRPDGMHFQACRGY